MSIAHSGIKVYPIAAKFFVQRSNKVLTLAGTNVTATVAPHPPVANSHQIAAKDNLSVVDGNAHAMSLNGAPAPIIYLRVVA